MGEPFELFVGIDWGSDAHQVCVVGSDRTVRDEFRIEHTAAALDELVRRLVQMAPVGAIAVGIETPRGLVVERLLESGCAVFSINPRQSARFRERFSVSGAKDDRRDARMLADCLVTDLDVYRRVLPDDPAIAELRELSRVYDDLEQDQRRLSNRLRAQLERYFPEALRLVPGADEPWIWTLIEEAPTPRRAAALRRQTVQRILRDHRIRRFTVDEVLAELRAPKFTTSPGTEEAVSSHALLLLPLLRAAHEQRRRCEKRMQDALDALSSEDSEPGQKSQHRDVRIVLSLPGMGTIVGAAVLGEAWRLLAERNYHGLRIVAGAAPVTDQSGKQSAKPRSRRRPSVRMRRACNGRLREAVFLWCLHSVRYDERSKSIYRSMRARGHTHGRAIRGLADRQLQVLIAMLRSGSEYDPARRQKAA